MDDHGEATDTDEQSRFLSRLYARRFPPEADEGRRLLWRTLADELLQRYVPEDGAVLDVGGGRCEFVNAIRAKRRVVLDLDPNAKAAAADGVEVVVGDVLGEVPDTIADGTFDVVFVSNFFEHLRDADDLITVLARIRGWLRPGGELVVLQPNFRFAYKQYFDFVDHRLILTDRSMAEALESADFRILELLPQHLPFTTSSGAGKVATPTLVKWYLKVPLAWKVLGGQMFVRATPTGPATAS